MGLEPTVSKLKGIANNGNNVFMQYKHINKLQLE